MQQTTINSSSHSSGLNTAPSSDLRAEDYLPLTPNTATLIDFIEDGKDTRHFRFQLLDPSTTGNPEPGQFFMLTLPGAGEAPFTYTVLPDQQGIFHALVRKMGQVTTALFQCQPGTKVGIRGPFGKGWPINSLADKKVLIVAGGCGLAPLSCLIDQLIRQQHPHLALVYGARNRPLQMLQQARQHWQQHIALFDILEETGGAQPSDGRQELKGTPINTMDQVLEMLEWEPDTLLICGPEGMMKVVAEDFLQRGLPANSIWLSIERRMHCAVGTCGHCYLTEHHLSHHYACKDGPTYRWDSLQPSP